uniref:Phosphagen kinase N-terminal domain-containing protein n=1 Tax=Neolamprologus brichardi TaxID=32507 RepID=A0A3Q4MGV4_NEOBR
MHCSVISSDLWVINIIVGHFTLSSVFVLSLKNLIPPDPMARFHLKRGFPQEEFPDLCRNFTWMGRILTLDLYRRQFNRCTQSGVIFDDVTRPGDYLGPVAVGCVAGDAESYILFCDFFDRVIEAYHEQKITSRTPESCVPYNQLISVRVGG